MHQFFCYTLRVRWPSDLAYNATFKLFNNLNEFPNISKNDFDFNELSDIRIKFNETIYEKCNEAIHKIYKLNDLINTLNHHNQQNNNNYKKLETYK